VCSAAGSEAPLRASAQDQPHAAVDVPPTSAGADAFSRATIAPRARSRVCGRAASPGLVVLLVVVATLGAGALSALACVFRPSIARFFLNPHRAEVEVRQYAQSLFLDRELFATRGHTGVLLLVSMFERQVVLLPDRGLEERLSGDASKEIVRRMTAALAAGRVGSALEDGLAGLENALAASATGPCPENELPDTIVEEEGA